MVLTLRLCVLYLSGNNLQLLPYTSSNDWFFKLRWRRFSARYALRLYIRMCFVFKGLKLDILIIEGMNNTLSRNIGHQSSSDAAHKHEDISYTAAKTQNSQQQRNWDAGFFQSQDCILTHWRTEGRQLRNLESLSAAQQSRLKTMVTAIRSGFTSFWQQFWRKNLC
jgi:hypothetical protein